MSNPDGTMEDALRRSSDLVSALIRDNQHLRQVMGIWRDYFVSLEGTTRDPLRIEVAIGIMIHQFDSILAAQQVGANRAATEHPADLAAPESS